MPRTLHSLLLATLVTAGTSAFAQEAAAPAAEPEPAPAAEAETPEAAEPAAEAETAEPAAEAATAEPTGPQIGETYVADTHGDWEQRCIKAAEGEAEDCSIYQLLRDGGGQPVSEITIASLDDGRVVNGQALVAGITVVAPLETLLTQQLTLSVDGGDAQRYPFTFCNRGGCLARIGFTQAEVDAFKRGNAANLRLVPAAAPDQAVDLQISLSGFTAGFDALSN